MNLNIDIAIVIIFLIATLIAGFGYGRTVTNIKDYALGGRNFSTGALVATIVATWTSGSGFFITLSKTYSDGLIYVVASLGISLCIFITAFVFVPRMGEFLGSTSVAEVMGNLYGKNVQIITAFAGIIGSTGLIAVQFKAFGNICAYFFNFDPSIAVVFAGCIVTTYSAFGGIRAVTHTDVLQFCTFGIAIPLVGLIIWNKCCPAAMFNFDETIYLSKFDYGKVLNFNNPEFWEMIPLLLYFAVPTFRPEIFQRILIGNNIAQVKKAFLISGFLLIVFELALAWIPFLIFEVNPNLKANELLSYIIDHYTITGLKGLVLVGVIAMAMSTADSSINSSSVLFSNDICKPFGIKFDKELIIAKTFSFILGILGVLLSLYTNDLLAIILTASSFYMPIVTTPLILTILGFRSSAKSVLIGMGAGFITTIVWKILNINIDVNFIGMLVNLVFLMGSHYLLSQSGGWVGIKDKSFLNAQKQEKLERRQKLLRSIKEFNLVKFFNKQAPSNELTYMRFGIYCIIYTITTMYSSQTEMIEIRNDIIMYMYQIMLITGTMMGSYPIWPLSIRYELKEMIVKSWWFIAVFYMLTFFNSFFLLFSNFAPLQFILFTVNIIIAILLTGWRIGSVMMIIGSYLGIVFYKHLMQLDKIDFIFGSPSFVFMYVLTVIGVLIVVFFKPKEEEQQEKLKNMKMLGGIIAHEMRTPFAGIKAGCWNLKECVPTLIEAYKKATEQGIVEQDLDKVQLDYLNKNVNNIESTAQRALMIVDILLMSLKGGQSDFKLEPISVRECVLNAIEIFPFSDEERKLLIINDLDNFTINGNETVLTHIMFNLITNSLYSIKKIGKGDIMIRTEVTDLNYKIIFRDTGSGIKQEVISKIFNQFYTTKHDSTGIGLSFCQDAMHRMSGEIMCESVYGEYAEFTLNFYKSETEKL